MAQSKESACQFRSRGLIPGLGRSPGEGNGNPLQYSCLENPMGRGAQTYSPWGCQRVGHDLATKQQQFIVRYGNLEREQKKLSVLIYCAFGRPCLESAVAQETVSSQKVLWGRLLKSSFAILYAFIDCVPTVFAKNMSSPHVMLGTMDSNRRSICNDFQDQENQGVLRHVELLRSRTGVLGGWAEKEECEYKISLCPLPLGAILLIWQEIPLRFPVQAGVPFRVWVALLWGQEGEYVKIGSNFEVTLTF